MKDRWTVMAGALAAALALSVALRAEADAPAAQAPSERPAAESPPSSQSIDSLDARSARARRIVIEQTSAREEWQREYRGLLADHRAAHERLAQLRQSWGRNRRRQRLRGTPRAEARAEIEAAEQALGAAAEAIEEFRERARTERVAPGWLFAVEREFPDVVSALASR